MSGEVSSETTRPRPLSAGLWTLFGWLRRGDSVESISSTCSDRTAISFAFLHPNNYGLASPPLVLPPPDPPSDTYNKRIQRYNLRREYERDLTLHRKYHLPIGEVGGGYDAFSLPPVSKVGRTRDRRAASEGFQTRRGAHVPGKRRAPPPPITAAPYTRSLPLRRRATKRPAPKPPILSTNSSDGCSSQKENDKENTPMLNEVKSAANTFTSIGSDKIVDCKLEKYSRKETKIKTEEKSFLKQIFENKKRNSANNLPSVKVLPSISELDKQAADLLQTYKLKVYENNNNGHLVETNETDSSGTMSSSEMWFCTRCLKKYDSSMVTCLECLSKDKMAYNGSKEKQNKAIPFNKINSPNKRSEEKEKLKEMLKEMKNSLPKRPKSEVVKSSTKIEDNFSKETPTLPIGSKINSLYSTHAEPSTSKQEDIENKSSIADQKVIITKTTVLIHSPGSSSFIDSNKVSDQNKKFGYGRDGLFEPMKISALLNPVYIPKNNKIVEPVANVVTDIIPQAGVTKENKPKLPNMKAETVSTTINSEIIPVPNITNKEPSTTDISNKQNNTPTLPSPSPLNHLNTSDKTPTIEASKLTPTGNKIMPFSVDLLSKRRELISQLEKSIAAGDEQAAAEAAVKLAQLKLSCSVLSFSSQIATEKTPTIVDKTHVTDITSNKSEKQVGYKVNTSTQSENVKIVKEDKLTNGVPHLALHNKDQHTGQIYSPKKFHENLVQAPSTSKNLKEPVESSASIQIWIEDKETTRGPVKLQVSKSASLGQLRNQVETTLGLATRLQRWIIGRTLCTEDTVLLSSIAGPQLDAPFYVCLVESDTNKEGTSADLTAASKPLVTNNEIKLDKANDPENNKNKSEVYTELMQLELQAFVPNTEAFDCGICMEECEPGTGVVLRDCVHTFCRDCLAAAIRHCEEASVACPATGCTGTLEEREIRSLVSKEEYERWLARSLAVAESGTRHTFHCRTRDCTGWAFCEPGVRRFPCPVCHSTNCVPCQAIHEGETCEQHRLRLKEAAAAATSADSSNTDEGTRTFLEGLIARGEALECPECKAVITKKWGCDWVRCSACKTEICWVTRGRRWGPQGKGDTSAGCRCGVDGKRCHPSCGYCH